MTVRLHFVVASSILKPNILHTSIPCAHQCASTRRRAAQTLSFFGPDSSRHLRSRSFTTSLRWRSSEGNGKSDSPSHDKGASLKSPNASQAMETAAEHPGVTDTPGLKTPGTLQPDPQDPSSIDSEAHGLLEAPIGRRKQRNLRKERPAYIPSKDRPIRKPKGRPISVPDAHLFEGRSTRQLKNRLKGKTYEEIPVATWYADQAAPPVLLTFDAFDTLYTPKEPIPKQYADVARQYGYNVSEEDVKRSFRNAFKDASARFPNQGKDAGLTPSKWWHLVIEATFQPLAKDGHVAVPGPLKTELFRRFSTSQGYRLFPDVPDLLNTIGTGFAAKDWAPKRTMLGVVSNSDPRVRSILESFDIEIFPSMFPPRAVPVHARDDPEFGPAHFAFATLSYECGIEKPNTDIWTAAVVRAQQALDAMAPVARLTRSGRDLLSNVGSEFHRCHVGDDFEKDIVSALRAGWDAILLDRSAVEPVSERTVTLEPSSTSTAYSRSQSPQVHKVTVINSLSVLPGIMTRERIAGFLDARRDKITDAFVQRHFPQPQAPATIEAGKQSADLRTEDSRDMLGPPMTAKAKEKKRARFKSQKALLGL